MNRLDTDILIVGGGLVGAALMVALQRSGLKTTLIEAQSYEKTMLCEGFDARTLAVSPASANILKTLGLWEDIADKAQPIEHIHVSEKGRFATAHLDGSVTKPLGHVLELQAIQRMLHDHLPAEHIMAPAELVALDKDKGRATIQSGETTMTIHAGLIVAADGGQSTVRRLAGLTAQVSHYGYEALVANIGLQRSHHNWAYERFTEHGPLAMLPMREKRAALIWSVPRREAQHLLNLPEKEFLTRLQREFGYKLGCLLQVGQRAVYPLKKIVMSKQTDWPLVFAGNAAHMLHPVAGQGFNLGLRDVAALAQCIYEYGLNRDMLSHYEAMRKSDQKAIITLTDGLLKVFDTKLPGAALARGLGMVMMDNSTTLRALLSRYARGFGGVVPDLVCGIDLVKGQADAKT